MGSGVAELLEGAHRRICEGFRVQGGSGLGGCEVVGFVLLGSSLINWVLGMVLARCLQFRGVSHFEVQAHGGSESLFAFRGTPGLCSRTCRLERRCSGREVFSEFLVFKFEFTVHGLFGS